MNVARIPKAFFVTSGVGMDIVQANAFDRALCDAGIGGCNLVEVSSILPAGIVEVKQSSVSMRPGEITFCVLSRADGKSGEVIGAGIGYGWMTGVKEDANGEEQIKSESEPESESEPWSEFGIISEDHGHYSEEYLTARIEEKLYTMAKIRGKKIHLKKMLVDSVEVENGSFFGSVVVALVFVF